MRPSTIVIVCLSLLGLTQLVAGELSFLNEADKARLRKVVLLKDPLSANTLADIYYNVNLNSLLDKTYPGAAKVCAHIIAEPAEQLESIYFVTAAGKQLNCKLDAAKYATKLQAFVKDDLSVQDLHRIVLSLANLGKPVDSAKFSKLLLAAIKKDDTLLNTGLAFQIASKFNKPEDRNVFFDKIADVIVQADEVNEKLLQFEGGLGVTAAIINGIYELSTAANKPIGISKEQALKFIHYFLSRKFVLAPKGACEVIETLSLFTTNKFHIPYIISPFSSSSMSSEKPVLTLKVANVLGLSVGPLTVTGTTLSRKGERSPILKNIVFKPVTGDSTLFAYDFFETPLLSGFYTLSVNAAPQKADPRVLGNTGVEIQTSIQTQIKIDNVELTVADVEVGSQSKKLQYPSAMSEVLEVDYLQRLQLKFQLKDVLNQNNVEVHQAFMRFYNEKTKQEIIFISELDSTGAYKVDLNLQTRSKDFNHLSGVYQVNLIIGDALVMNSLDWNLGKVFITFAAQPAAAAEAPVSEFAIKPEIKHLFREQDKRPHPMVSNFFTLLVIVPFLALFIMWYKIGVRFDSFHFSLSTILFHTSLALIFLLYGCFFLKLNMFQTIKYLAGFSFVAYLSGHSLLSSLIKKNK